MKILFLDHDGVICLARDRIDDFNAKAIVILNEIIDATDCEIVVSSDWRHYYNLSDMRKLYVEQGVKKVPIGFTPYIVSTVEAEGRNPEVPTLEEGRIKEIQQWLRTHDFNKKLSWCAVDDMDLSALGPNFIRTPRINEGIKQTGIKEKIISVLMLSS